MEIRKALDCESEEILMLYKSLIGLKDCLWDDNYPNMRLVKSDIESKNLYVIKKDEKIIAAACAGMDTNLLGLDCWNSEIKRPKVLSRIGVLPEYQNQGVAKRIIEHIEKDIVENGHDALYFIVGKANGRAIRLYESLNYYRCGELNIYNADWFCYEKKLI